MERVSRTVEAPLVRLIYELPVLSFRRTTPWLGFSNAQILHVMEHFNLRHHYSAA